MIREFELKESVRIADVAGNARARDFDFRAEVTFVGTRTEALEELVAKFQVELDAARRVGA